jgi:hypothetical protein
MSASPAPTAAGNPIDVTSGNKYQFEKDLGYPGQLAAGFSRHYSSAAAGGATLGPGWTHDFETMLSREQRGKSATIRIQQSDGRVLEFRAQVSTDGKNAVFRAGLATVGLVEESATSLAQLPRINSRKSTALDGADASAARP